MSLSLRLDNLTLDGRGGTDDAALAAHAQGALGAQDLAASHLAANLAVAHLAANLAANFAADLADLALDQAALFGQRF